MSTNTLKHAEAEAEGQSFCALCLRLCKDVGELDTDAHCATCAKELEELESFFAEQTCDGCGFANAACTCEVECQYCFARYVEAEGYGLYCSRYCQHSANGFACYCCYE